MKMFELLFRKKTKSLIHPCLSEFFIGNKSSSFYFFGIKSFFANKAVDMGIPFQISAKSMKSQNRTENDLVSVIFIGVGAFGFFNKELFHFDFSVLCIIKNTGKGVSGSNKKKIQKGSVFNKITS